MRERSQLPPRLDDLPSANLDEFLSASAEDLHATGLASPPYHPVAGSSNIHLPINDPNTYPPSPAYASKVDLMAGDERNEKTHHNHRGFREAHENSYDTKPKPTVHYNDGERPGYHSRDNSTDLLNSRPASIAGTDYEEDSDDYDWSGEEDLVDEEAKFGERMGVKNKPAGWGIKRIVTLLFSTLIGSTFLTGVIATPGIIIYFYWYKPNPTEHRLYVTQNVQAWLFWAAANLLISWYLAMCIDIIPVVIRFFISAAWGHVSETIKSRIEMYDSIKDTIKPLFYAASGWASWVIIFGHIYELHDLEDPSKSRASYTQRLAQVVAFLFFFALVICAQQMLSHSIAFSFHRTAYKDRVDSLQEALAAIEKLRDYRPPVQSSRRSPGTRTPIFGSGGPTTPFSEKDYFGYLSGALHSASMSGMHTYQRAAPSDGEDGDVDDNVVGGSEKSALKGKGKRDGRRWQSWLGKYSRQGSNATTVPDPSVGIEMIASPIQSRPMTPSGLNPHRYPPSPRGSVDVSGERGEATIVQAAKVIKAAVLHDARNVKGKEHERMTWNVNSAHEAKRLARSIYTRFKDRGKNYLLPSHFYPAFPDHAAAEAAFRVFDKDNNGDISRAEIKTTLLKVYKERRFLARSMRDVGAALKTLNYILLFFAFVILFFISLSVFGVQVGDSLTSVYTIGIAASFIFKNSASSAFDAIMFLFVTHPYDTGDRCFIDKDVLIVKKMGLFATVFTRSDGTETYYFNSQLFSKFITNVRRSGKMFENLTMQLDWRTPLEKIDALEQCLNDWLSTEENRWYEPNTSIMLQNISYMRYMEITIGIAHNGNWQDWGLRNARKTAFHAAVQYYCHQLDISGFESSIPIVYTDPKTGAYNPSPPSTPLPYEEEAKAPVGGQRREGTARALQESTMGFLPPVANRASNLTRARKSKGRKSIMRAGMDG